MNNSEKLLSLMADLKGDVENLTITEIDSGGGTCINVRVFGEDKTVTRPSRNEAISATIKLITNALKRQAQELESKNKRQLRSIEIAKKHAENFTKLADIYKDAAKLGELTVKINSGLFSPEHVKGLIEDVAKHCAKGGSVSIESPVDEAAQEFKEGDRVNVLGFKEGVVLCKTDDELYSVDFGMGSILRSVHSGNMRKIEPKFKKGDRVFITGESEYAGCFGEITKKGLVKVDGVDGERIFPDESLTKIAKN